MSGAPVVNGGVFLIQTLFGLYILALMLRFLLQTVRADFYNPLVQFLVKITNPLLLPLRRIIPGLWGLDLAAIALMLIFKLIELGLIFSLVGSQVSFISLFAVALIQLLQLVINVLFWSIIIQVIMSWVNPDPRHPAVSLLYQLTEPVLRPARQLIPPISGLDLSPMVVLIVLQLIKIVPLTMLAQAVGY